MVMDRDYYPVITFAFSKKDVEALGAQMQKLDLNSDEEKDNVSQIYSNAPNPITLTLTLTKRIMSLRSIQTQ